jgi:hypothetical protein
MILTRSTRLIQPQGPVEVSPEFGDAVAFVPGAVNPTFATRTTRVLTTGGMAERGSAATGGVSPSTAAYIAFPEASRTFLGNKPHWAFIAGNIANTSANSWILGAGQPSANAGILLTYLASTGRLEFATRFGGTWYPSTAPVTLSANRDFEAGYSIDADGTLRLYWDGLEVLVKTGVGATTPTPNLPPTAGMAYASQANNNLYGNSTSIAFAAVGQSAYSDRMGARIAANPWQLFRPVQRRIYFDMGAGGGATPVSGDQAATYSIRGAVSSDQAASYAIRSSVSADLSASYNIQTAIAVSSDLPSGYEIRTSAQSDALAEYAIRASVQADSSAGYVVRGAVLSDASASYVVRTSSSADLIAAYEIQTASGVSSSFAASYNVRAAVQADVSAAYDLRTAVGAISEHAFMVRGLVSSDLDASYTVEAAITQVYADLQAAYLVDGGAVVIPSQFIASVPAGVFSAAVPSEKFSAAVPGGNQ